MVSEDVVERGGGGGGLLLYVPPYIQSQCYERVLKTSSYLLDMCLELWGREGKGRDPGPPSLRIASSTG